MILNVEKFIRSRRADWNEFERMLDHLGSGGKHRLAIDEAQRFHYLYERVAADLTKLGAYAVEPQTKQYLESLVARGFGEMHGTVSRKLPFTQALLALLSAFPMTVRRHFKALVWVFVIFGGGAIFGAGALALDPSSKPVLMPFSHLLGDPSDRVAEEELSEGANMEDGKSTFSTYLMTHNIKVSIMTLALGMTFGIGTSIFLFYNGAILGAVMMDYVLAGETVFLTGWLLPHGSVEIPAILLAGQGGLLLGSTLLFAKDRMSLGERLRSIRSDLLVLIAGIAVLLVWAGIIESFFSQYHEPVLPYAVKIAFGAIQLAGVFAYFMFMGRSQEGEATVKTRYNELVIQTPEGVQFVHRLASPVSRFIAVAVDTFAIWTLSSMLSTCIALLGWISADLAMAFYILFYFVLSIGYFILLEMIWRGQTLGKRMMRLQVIDANGLKLKPSQFVLRNLLRFVDSLPVLYFLGGICSIVSARSQRLGDLAAGTVVVRIPEIKPPDLSGFSDNLYNSFRDYPRQEALLRQRISPDQSAIALQAITRRDEMDATERAQLFSTLADTFREEVEFPDEIASAMSDEQYIRNCIDTIYRVAK